MKKPFVFMACIIIALIILSMLIGAVCQSKEVRWEPYVVRPGDTLYDIATAVNAQNTEEFSYEVCKKNGLEKGGLLFPGDIILIYTEGE